MGAYNTTKAAVVALSETLYSELRPHGVHVGVLCPSFFPTRLLEDFRAPSMRLKGFAEKMFARSKFSADDVADAALAGMAKGHLHIVPMPDARAVIGELNPSRSDSAGRDPAWPGREGAEPTAVA